MPQQDSPVTPAADVSFPFSTVDDLSEFFLFRLLSEEQQREMLSIEDKPARHRKFAELLRANGYLQADAN